MSMRHLVAASAGLFLLQAPGLVQGLPVPHPLRGAKQTPIPPSPQSTSTNTTLTLTIATPTPVLDDHAIPIGSGVTTTVTASTSSSIPSNHPKANNSNNNNNENEDDVDDDDDENDDDDDGYPDGDLTRELAELATLRLQLAALAREIREREAWLARQSGVVKAAAQLSSSSMADCDGLGCVGRVFVRRVRHALHVAGGGGHGPDDLGGADGESAAAEETGPGRGIPRPPWRGGSGVGVDESDAAGGVPEGAGENGEGYDPLLVGLCAAVLMSVVALLATGGYSSCADAGSISLCGCVGCQQRPPPLQVEEERPGWDMLELDAPGLEPWPRYTDSDGPSYAVGDEKRRIEVQDEAQPGEEQPGEEQEDTTSWDEKRAEEQQAEEAMTLSDELDPEEPQTEDSAVPREGPGGGETEEPTMADEITAFRSAVDLVEALIAGEEARMASRGRPPC
ncbi:hypothetical protein VTJ83DRAFT_4764 [Remersonia thermophila]|uniref:Uncharacterized protein n=1 Tax=Remersonia thermophila TaxID=72144 RepID=A0ABR4DAV2_9PEZI